MNLRIIAFIFSLICSLTATSQLSRYARFSNIETKQFGHSSISSQVWMNDGSFWAITENGIIHHNGFSGEDFDADSNGEQTVVSDDIMRLNKISEEEIWISYRDTCILTLLNPLTKTFNHYCVEELLEDGELKGLVVKVLKDQDDQLWLCTWGAGLVKWSPSGEGNKVYIFNDGQVDKKSPGKFVKDIWIKDDGNFVVTFFFEYTPDLSFPGLFNPKTEEFKRFPIPELIDANTDVEGLKGFYRTCFKIVHFIHQDKNGKYWFGTYSGLLYVDFENMYVESIYNQERAKNFQNQVNVLDVVELDGKLWIATSNKGVMVVDTESRKVVYHLSDPMNSGSIYSNRIAGISIDPQGNIWIANGTGILSVYVPFIHNFRVFYWKDMELDYSNSSAQSIPVNQLYVKDSKNIFVSSRLGVVKLDFETMSTSRFYRVDHISNRARHKKGITHIKTVDEDLFVLIDGIPGVMNLKTGNVNVNNRSKQHAIMAFRHEPKVQRTLLFRNDYSGSKEIAVTQFDWNKNSEVDLFRDVSEGRFSETFSFVTNAGKWIVSDWEGGFFLLDSATNTAKLFNPNQEENYFPDPDVNCVLIQNDSEILIGTKTALYSFDEVTHAYEDISDKIELKKGEGVNSIIKDKKGRIWMALNNEMVCWFPEEERTVRYSKLLGVDVSDFLPAIAQQDELGNLYFAAMYGILVFHPDSVMIPQDNFEVSISGVKVNESYLNSEEQADLMEGKREFHWSDNYIEFFFHTNQVFQLGPHRFQYKLEGLNDRWVSCGATNHVRFDNLQYGEYNLLFKGVNSYGIESDVLSIPFSIQKPFWLKWWFYTLMGVLFIIAVYFVVKGRMAALRKRSELLEQTVEERTAEVVEQKKEADRMRIEAEHQKDIVEEKQQEITDSITYAKRIQDAIMPSEEVIQNNLPKSFVMYRPKDIVAGDFYWMEPLSEDEVIFAAADCTGHGVPGAMVSVVCNNALNRSVREFGLTDPGKLLDSTRELVIQQFEQSATETHTERDDTIKDGMDISVCYLNRKTGKMLWAGANNPLWIIRDDELIEIKGNKQPIGKFEPSEPFTTHEVEIKENDRFYIFSDGYADQFGGDKGKKFKSSSLKKLLLSIHKDPIKTQHFSLEEEFDKWKGDYEQLDDVCMIGFQI